MQPLGFILLVLGLMITFSARRIVLGRIKLEDVDKKEMQLLTDGGVIAVRVVGFILALVGLMLLAI